MGIYSKSLLMDNVCRVPDMKILCVSDNTDILIYSQNAPQRYKDVDLIISAGDLPLKYYDYMQTMLRKDVYYVYGNHNLEEFDEQMVNKVNLADREYYGNLVDGRCVYDKMHDLIIVGLGGCSLYNYGKSQYTESQMKARMRKLYFRLLLNRMRYGRYMDILVTHAPARGYGDDVDPCHRGFECFLPFLDRYKPKYMLYGHVHLDDRNTQREYEYHGVKLINIYKNYILEDDEIRGGGTECQ